MCTLFHSDTAYTKVRKDNKKTALLQIIAIFHITFKQQKPKIRKLLHIRKKSITFARFCGIRKKAPTRLPLPPQEHPTSPYRARRVPATEGEIDIEKALTEYMRIALIGYGKMGHTIEEVARERGHQVVCVIDKNNQEAFDSEAFASADVAIEFTTPATAEANIRRAWSKGKPVVCGTTGWAIEQLAVNDEQLLHNRRTLVWSSNYSVGVNILFALNRQLAEIMSKYPEYQPSITEVHHVHKLDAPSGTAKTLQYTIENLLTSPTPPEEGLDGCSESPLYEGVGGVEGRAVDVPITSIREGEVPGIHTVTWDSEVDTISISHSAKSRKGFALGAVLAAEWIRGKRGFHTMQEVLFNEELRMKN